MTTLSEHARSSYVHGSSTLITLLTSHTDRWVGRGPRVSRSWHSQLEGKLKRESGSLRGMRSRHRVGPRGWPRPADVLGGSGGGMDRGLSVSSGSVTGRLMAA